MAINNMFPASYNPYYYQQYQPQMQQNNQQGSLIWVQGEAGAKSFLVAPNTTVQLWDSEKQRIYLKSADASGMPSMKVLDYTIQDSTGSAPVVSAVQNEPVQYVAREEFDALKTQISGLKKQIEKLRKVDDDE